MGANQQTHVYGLITEKNIYKLRDNQMCSTHHIEQPSSKSPLALSHQLTPVLKYPAASCFSEELVSDCILVSLK